MTPAVRGQVVLGGEARAPDKLELRGRSSFGSEVDATHRMFGDFDVTDDTMAIYYGAPGWVRTTAGPGDVAQGDAATVERAEIDTLGIIEPAIGGHPTLNLSYEFWIPNSHYAPGGGCAIVIGQINVTSYGPPVQILYHTTGTLRLRSLIAGAFQHTVLMAAGTFRGRWVKVDIRGVWSKTSAGQTVVSIDGVKKYELLNTANIGDTALDASKAYAKLGVYRTAADTDPARGLASVWYRNAVVRTA